MHIRIFVNIIQKNFHSFFHAMSSRLKFLQQEHVKELWKSETDDRLLFMLTDSFFTAVK